MTCFSDDNALNTIAFFIKTLIFQPHLGPKNHVFGKKVNI